jgi:microcystin-dependent protein
MEPFLGQLMCVGFNFAPVGWALCDGSLLPISQNTALFSLLGTTYGGDGVTTFGLPDLRGRLPIGAGQGPGLQPYTQGQTAGSEGVTLVGPQLPLHTHPVACSTEESGSLSPANAVFASHPAGFTASGNAAMGGAMLAPSGGSQSHANLQPYIVINWIIATEGIFPSPN